MPLFGSESSLIGSLTPHTVAASYWKPSAKRNLKISNWKMVWKSWRMKKIASFGVAYVLAVAAACHVICA